MRKLFTTFICLVFVCSLYAQRLYATTPAGGKYEGGTICKLELGTLTTSYSFDAPDGNSPLYTTLVQASDSKLYGVTDRGGSSGGGIIFSYNPATTTYTVLKQLDFTIGKFGKGSLIQATNGKLYGMTYVGGSSYNYGVIFSYDINANIYTKLFEFNNTNGAYAYGSLMQAKDGKLYGMTSSGGVYGRGVIFSFNPATNIFTKLVDFDNSNGNSPYGNLIQAIDGKLYGMTSYGGINSCGVIFSYDPITAVYTKVYDLTNTGGCNPHGSLTEAANGKLYGMTKAGGNNDYGTIFSFDITSAAYTKIKDMYSTTGFYPYGNLMQASDGMLYGMASAGGQSGFDSSGVIFSFNTATNKYTIVKNCNWSEGASPYGSLMQATNGKLYGLTSAGGSSNIGVLFSFNIANKSYKKLRNFGVNNTGDSPKGGIIKDSSGILYGLTANGGKDGCGVIYSYTATTSLYTKLKDLDYNNGAHPDGNLTLAQDGKFYGVTSDGGSYQSGVIFSYNPVTAVYTRLFDFNSVSGMNPKGSLVQATNGKLYGMTYRGGYYDYGVVFSFDPVTNTYTKLINFNYSNGAYPCGNLIQATDGKLYGLTSYGGSYDGGVLFSFDPVTGAFSDKFPLFGPASFESHNSLIQAADGKLYGMTPSGGFNFYGTIFSYNPSSNIYSKLKDFDYTNGAYPVGSLMQASDGKLYGMTQEGGTSSLGVAFSLNPLDNTYTKLQDFNGANGKTPLYAFFTEVPPIPTIKISNASLQEGNSGQKTMAFNVTLSIPSAQPITIDYKTKDGTATAADDYIIQKGRLTFTPGVKKQTIFILVNGDTQVEGTEKFKIVLGNPVNAALIDSIAVGSILNDDNGFSGTPITGKIQNSSPIVTVTPNPASSTINVKLNGYTGNIILQLRDMQGKIIRQAKLQSDIVNTLSQQFDIATLASGTYLIVVLSEESNETKKFIKK